MDISVVIADKIVNFIYDQTQMMTIVCDTTGAIIAARDRSRIGVVHAGSKRILNEKLAEIVVSQADADQSAGKMKPGVNLPIWFGGQLIGTFGIGGDP